MPDRPAFRTGDQSLVREINLSLILNLLREHAPVSRAALAELTGLNKSTVSSLIDELISYHFAREVGFTSAQIGRPSRLLELNPQAGYILSAEIGVDFMSVICTDFAARILWQQQETHTSVDQETVLAQFLTLLAQGRTVSSRQGLLLGVSVGVPGLVDYRNRMLLFAPNLGWQNVPLGDMLRSTFVDTPVFVDNEANLAVLGEYYFGVAQGYQAVLYISGGTGVGGGLLHSGYLFRGKAGFASEFGHMTMNPNGERCNCGNRGCWETQVSQSALFRYIQHDIHKGQTTSLPSYNNGDLCHPTVSLVTEAARNGDRVALRALKKVGRHLGVGIASLVNAFNPDLVVFGGTLSLAWEFLNAPIQDEVQHRALRWNAQSARIVPARHGPTACVLGGAAMVYQAVLTRSTSIVRSTA